MKNKIKFTGFNKKVAEEQMSNVRLFNTLAKEETCGDVFEFLESVINNKLRGKIVFRKRP